MSNTITPTVFYRTLNVEGLEIFYREAGPRDASTVLLLHGFPSSSHMFLGKQEIGQKQAPAKLLRTSRRVFTSAFLSCGHITATPCS
jgi:pimeloyl-ACP methyl ester carboxylesterase